jgi:hypothetical protein
MARNVFVSYKYADENVQHLFGHFPTKARHYVDEIEKLLAAEDHIFFGEHDGEDLSDCVYFTPKVYQYFNPKVYHFNLISKSVSLLGAVPPPTGKRAFLF